LKENLQIEKNIEKQISENVGSCLAV